MEIKFDKMREIHLSEVIDIFNYYVSKTTSAYREKIVNKDFGFNFLAEEDVYCSFVIKDNADRIIGFCLLEPHMNISTFSEIAEVMYFIHHEYTGKGIGSLTLKKLENEARKIGVRALIADISTENNGSIDFHKKNGFVEYGRLPSFAKKFNRHFGIVYLLKELD